MLCNYHDKMCYFFYLKMHQNAAPPGPAGRGVTVLLRSLTGLREKDLERGDGVGRERAQGNGEGEK